MNEDVIELQKNFKELPKADQNSKQAVANLVAPFKKKYGLSHTDAVHIARGEMPAAQLQVVMSKGAKAVEAAAKARYQVLKAMHTLALALNDETFYCRVWTYIIPDGADDDELQEIASDQEDTFNDAVVCFMDHWDEYARDGGLYIGKTVYPLPDPAKAGMSWSEYESM